MPEIVLIAAYLPLSLSQSPRLGLGGLTNDFRLGPTGSENRIVKPFSVSRSPKNGKSVGTLRPWEGKDADADTTESLI